MNTFKPNALQRALFIEVTNSVQPGYTDSLTERQFASAAQSWLMSARTTLVELAGIGQEGVRTGERYDRDTVLLEMMECMNRLPHDTLRWLNDYQCLRELANPEAMRQDDYLDKLRILATLSEGIPE